jgi:hypothetical protein
MMSQVRAQIRRHPSVMSNVKTIIALWAALCLSAPIVTSSAGTGKIVVQADSVKDYSIVSFEESIRRTAGRRRGVEHANDRISPYGASEKSLHFVDDGSPSDARPQHGAPDFILVIDGSPQEFSVRCILVDRRGAREWIKLVGSQPTSYALNARAVDCHVYRVDQHAGILRVELFAKDSSIPVGENSTEGAFGCVHIRSDGPWGKAFGRRCSRVIRF